MSIKQDAEEIKLRARRECTNVRVSMKERDCLDSEIEKKCREITEAANQRAAKLLKKDT